MSQQNDGGRRDDRAERIAAMIAAAPELTPEQAARIAALLRPSTEKKVAA